MDIRTIGIDLGKTVFHLVELTLTVKLWLVNGRSRRSRNLCWGNALKGSDTK
jgi:hypothetical protein